MQKVISGRFAGIMEPLSICGRLPKLGMTAMYTSTVKVDVNKGASWTCTFSHAGTMLAIGFIWSYIALTVVEITALVQCTQKHT